MAVSDEQIVKALKRWGKPTAEAYRQHLAACESVGCDPEPFLVYAADVFGTPEHMRDWLLQPTTIENYEPFVRFAQYETPRTDEMPMMLWRGKKK